MKKVFLILAGLHLTGAFFLTNINSTSKTTSNKFHQLYVLGDSLSDTGAIVGAGSEVANTLLGHGFEMDAPFYQNHSFSNGKVAAEVLADKLDLNLDAAWDFKFLFKEYRHTGNNYAIGAAQASELKTIDPKGVLLNNFTINKQVDALLKQQTIQADDLTLFQVGTNDFWFQVIGAPSPDAQKQILQTSVKNQAKALQRLVDHGNKHLLVLNTPDLGKIPEYRGTEQEAMMSDLTAYYNDLWMNMIENLQVKYPHYFKLFDLYNIFDDLLADFESKGGDVTKGATYYELSGDAFKKGHLTPKYNEGVSFETINDHFFFDFAHPTEPVHALIGELLYQMVQSAW